MPDMGAIRKILFSKNRKKLKTKSTKKSRQNSRVYMKMKNNRILLKTFTVDDQLGS